MHHPTTEKSRIPLVTALIETFGFSPWLATAVALFLGFLLAAALVWLWLSAPPSKMTILTGPPGTSFQRYAEAYRDTLKANHGPEVIIRASAGSLDNLKQLQDPNSGVDVAFVQGGLVGDKPPADLVSLGTVAYQPVWVFYRGTQRYTRLSELAGKRICVGLAGSGTNILAKALLEANKITGAPTTLVEQAADKASADLLAGRLDAVFLMGEAAPIETLRALLTAEGIQLFSFTQADAYVRNQRFNYLNKIVLPQGSIDFASNLPAQDVILVGPGVELLARKNLNSTLSDQIIDAAQVRHSRPSLLSRRNEFPAPLEREFPISKEAARYYKSGKGITGITQGIVQNYWLASLINRVLVAIVPILLLMIPMARILPIAYRWSVQLRIYRCYRPLLRLERDAKSALSPERAHELLARLDDIEESVNSLKVPASFAYQFYALRGHVAFVRSRLKAIVAAV